MAKAGPSLAASMSLSFIVSSLSHDELGRSWHKVSHVGALAFLSVPNTPWPWKLLLCRGSKSLRAACISDRGQVVDEYPSSLSPLTG